MTIVMLRSNPVDPDSRVEKEANAFIKAGYEVIILGWDRSCNYKTKETVFPLPNGNAHIVRFGIKASFGEGVKNLVPFIQFQFNIFKWLIANKDRYNIIHACDFDTAFSSYYSSKFLKNKKIIFVFDIFDYLFTTIQGRFKFIKRMIKNIQNNIINHSDGTIICSDERKMQINKSNPKKLAVIHNSPPNIVTDLTTLPLNSQKTKIVYVGILQDFRFILELIDIVKQRQDIELHIGGFGKYYDYIKQVSETYENIIFYGKLQYSKTLELENSCDIMTAIYDPDVDNHKYAAPNKFYEALMIGKPLIMVKGTGMSELVAKYDIGELMEFNSESLVNSIDNLISKKNKWPEISDRMKKLYAEQFSWDEMEKRLIQFYKEILEDNKD